MEGPGGAEWLSAHDPLREVCVPERAVVEVLPAQRSEVPEPQQEVEERSRGQLEEEVEAFERPLHPTHRQLLAPHRPRLDGAHQVLLLDARLGVRR